MQSDYRFEEFRRPREQPRIRSLSVVPPSGELATYRAAAEVAAATTAGVGNPLLSASEDSVALAGSVGSILAPPLLLLVLLLLAAAALAYLITRRRRRIV